MTRRRRVARAPLTGAGEPERYASAAFGFADEIDAAIAAIEQIPEAWPPTGRRGFTTGPANHG
jgi:hypothetical protein